RFLVRLNSDIHIGGLLAEDEPLRSRYEAVGLFLEDGDSVDAADLAGRVQHDIRRLTRFDEDWSVVEELAAAISADKQLPILAATVQGQGDVVIDDSLRRM